MVRLARAVLLFLVALLSAAALVFLLPWLKEGHGIEELPLFAEVAAGLAVLFALWAYFTRRTPLFRASGLIVLGLPLAAYLFLSARLVGNELQGRRLARTVRVLRLAEHEVRWPGFDGPVGLRLEIDLEHAIGRPGNLPPPKILMGRPRPLDRRSYSFGTFDDGARGFLAVPLFAETPAEGGLAAGSPAHVVYELYPGIVRRARAEEVCVTEGAAAKEPFRLVYADGSDLQASWVFFGRGGVSVDLSSALTEALRRNSGLQGRGEEWEALLHRLEPEGLEKAGFRRCDTESAGEVCYCRP